MNEPLVNIIIPVYKTKTEYLVASVESILKQTYHHIVVIIVDEGPENISKRILAGIKDDRLQILENKEKMGLSFSLNKGIDHSEGKYIFRMDGDDVARPDRIARQVAYLDAHPDVDVLGTYAETFGVHSKLFKSATDDAGIKAELFWKNPLVHPTVAFRTETIKKKNIRYTEGVAEDYRLWLTMAFKKNCKFAVMPEVLLNYRIHADQLTDRDKHILSKKDKNIVISIAKILNLKLSDQEIELYCKSRQGSHLSFKEIRQCITIMKKIATYAPASVSRTTLSMIFTKGIIKSLLAH